MDPDGTAYDEPGCIDNAKHVNVNTSESGMISIAYEEDSYSIGQ